MLLRMLANAEAHRDTEAAAVAAACQRAPAPARPGERSDAAAPARRAAR